MNEFDWAIYLIFDVLSASLFNEHNIFKRIGKLEKKKQKNKFNEIQNNILNVHSFCITFCFSLNFALISSTDRYN